MQRDMISVEFHTALRKWCDSSITSAAWNAFHVVDIETASHFYDTLYAGIQKATPTMTDKQLIAIIRNAILKEYDFIGQAPRALLYCIFRCFDEQDWFSYSLPLLLEFGKA